MNNIIVFKELVIHTPKKDLMSLCKTNKEFLNMCHQNKEFIKKELAKRRLYVTIESDPDEIEGDYVFSVSVSKTKPDIMFSDFLETHKFELINYNVDNIYVVFHFTDHVEIIKIFTDEKQAKQYFDKHSDHDIKMFNENENEDPFFQYVASRLSTFSENGTHRVALFDEDDNLTSSWQLFTVKLK
jgi:hypothetical protein